jgi:uncharacterized Fe-S cluster protein YjdI
MQTKQYQNNDITVTWEPSKCIHSANCFKGLPRVFNPNKKPWIVLENSSTETIINQVRQCPSGAISFKQNVMPTQSENINNDTNTNKLLKVQIAPNGPILLHGDFLFELNNEIKEVNANVTALCRCGNSNNKPFCDGSHRNSSFDK